MTDILQWLIARTDLSGGAKSMVIKEGICIFGTVCESLTKDFLKGRGSKYGFRQRTEKLVTLNVIDPELKKEIDWVWSIRSREHLYQIDSKEHAAYSTEDYNRALAAYKKLMNSLKDNFPKKE